MILERLPGLDGRAATEPGLLCPYQLLEHGEFLTRLQQEGGRMMTLPLA
ncbi:hypothetical protein C725_2792 [Pacificimonas flava]|uniref:Uncharacterized protein n=1 Tax=Pacificimonas flava TaxID=1234595 RepID=M2S8W8_9SPHN|nr:hypothetical protein C725_2792 [Pacificimonas flava]